MFNNFFDILDPENVWDCDIEALCVLTIELFNGVNLGVIFWGMGEWGKCLIFFFDILEPENVWDCDNEALCVLISEIFYGVNFGVMFGGMGKFLVFFWAPWPLQRVREINYKQNTG